VQPILGFIPHHAVRAVDHASGNFFAAVRGRQCINSASDLATAIMSSSTCQSAKSAFAFFVLRFKAHAGPHIGGDQIGAARRFHRVGKFFVVIGAVQARALRLDFVAGGVETCTLKSNTSAACSQVLHTLLESPIQATVLP